MIEYFDSHIYSFWFVAGFILLAMELLIFGFSTGFVLFLGLSALTTGGLVWAEFISASWAVSIASFAIGSVVYSAVLWRPFKMLQNSTAPVHVDTSDFIGHEFRLTENISLTTAGKTRYSGIEWHVEIDKSCELHEIPAGTLVKVVALDVGRFHVVPAN